MKVDVYFQNVTMNDFIGDSIEDIREKIAKSLGLNEYGKQSLRIKVKR